jgi:hypothetical protein
MRSARRPLARRRSTTNKMRRSWWAVVGIIAFAFVFQVFLRYQYISSGGTITKIDRLTGQATYVLRTPVAPSPSPLCTAGPGEGALDALARCRRR